MGYFQRLRFLSLALSIVIYITVLLLFKDRLGISCNYFVIFPVITAALGFGFVGGFISGSLALPVNLLMFYLLDRPEYGPASNLIAEASGIILGSVLGYLSDYFRKLEVENQHRREAEEELRKALRDKETLLKEVHHRVKNNLNIIKSLIQLQTNRVENEEFVQESEKLLRRVFSIALIHEQLFNQNYSSALNLNEYIPLLMENIITSYDIGDVDITYRIEENLPRLQLEKTTPLALIITELVTNSLKYAHAEKEKTRIRVQLAKEDLMLILSMCDNGEGFDLEKAKQKGGLGMKMIFSLADQLDGKAEFDTAGHTCFFMTFPFSNNE